MDEFLWPVRNVAEYAYCPRLFYLMQVEGIFIPSADTVKGKSVHRRVDKSSAAIADKDGDAIEPEDQRLYEAWCLQVRRLA